VQIAPPAKAARDAAFGKASRLAAEVPRVVVSMRSRGSPKLDAGQLQGEIGLFVPDTGLSGRPPPGHLRRIDP